MNASSPPATTIDAREAGHFGRMAADWWNPKGSSAMLHRLNPVRLRYIRHAADAHWGTDTMLRHPLAGRRVLDVGCGAGLLAEPLARLGGDVVGLDAAEENIDAARAHAAGQGLAIDYRVGDLAALAGGERFDLVTSLEVIEHVADVPAFLAGLARALAPGGLMILSTPNRTALSRFALIGVGETLGGIPPGTHDWDRFLAPKELEALARDAGLQVIDRSGIALSPTRGFVLSDDMRMDYLLTLTHVGGVPLR